MDEQDKLALKIGRQELQKRALKEERTRKQTRELDELAVLVVQAFQEIVDRDQWPTGHHRIGSHTVAGVAGGELDGPHILCYFRGAPVPADSQEVFPGKGLEGLRYTRITTMTNAAINKALNRALVGQGLRLPEDLAINFLFTDCKVSGPTVLGARWPEFGSFKLRSR